MRESKHTSGPWHVDYTDDGPLISTGDLLIASVSGSTEHIEVRGLDEQTTEANASLIAAAPDVLAALGRVLEHSERLNQAPQGSEVQARLPPDGLGLRAVVAFQLDRRQRSTQRLELALGSAFERASLKSSTRLPQIDRSSVALIPLSAAACAAGRPRL